MRAMGSIHHLSPTFAEHLIVCARRTFDRPLTKGNLLWWNHFKNSRSNGYWQTVSQPATLASLPLWKRRLFLSQYRCSSSVAAARKLDETLSIQPAKQFPLSNVSNLARMNEEKVQSQNHGILEDFPFDGRCLLPYQQLFSLLYNINIFFIVSSIYMLQKRFEIHERMFSQEITGILRESANTQWCSKALASNSCASLKDVDWSRLDQKCIFDTALI